MRLRQDFKLTAQEDTESIREWAWRVRTLGQGAHSTIAQADLKAVQEDQFVDNLTNSSIQESRWKEDIDGFWPNIERAPSLDNIRKAKERKQWRRATPVVRHACYKDNMDFEFRRRSGINAVRSDGPPNNNFYVYKWRRIN